MLSRLAMAFLPRSKCLLISWLQSPSAVILEPPQNKVYQCVHCFLIYLPWSDGTRCHDFRFWNREMKNLSYSSPFWEKDMFVIAILLNCNSPVFLPGESPGRWSLVGYSPRGHKESDTTERLHFHFHSAYKLNKRSDNMEAWHTPFLIWNHVPCPVLNVASWPSYRFLRRQVRWSGIPISWRIFHGWLWSTPSKALA